MQVHHASHGLEQYTYRFADIEDFVNWICNGMRSSVGDTGCAPIHVLNVCMIALILSHIGFIDFRLSVAIQHCALITNMLRALL